MPLLACRRVVLCLAAGAAAAFVALPASAADPAQLIQSTAAEAIDIIKTTTPGPARQAAIQRVLQTNFDLPYMGQHGAGCELEQGDARRSAPASSRRPRAPRPAPTASGSDSMAARRSPSAR